MSRFIVLLFVAAAAMVRAGHDAYVSSVAYEDELWPMGAAPAPGATVTGPSTPTVRAGGRFSRGGGGGPGALAQDELDDPDPVARIGAPPASSDS